MDATIPQAKTVVAPRRSQQKSVGMSEWLDALREEVERMESEIQKHRENGNASLLRADVIHDQQIHIRLLMRRLESASNCGDMPQNPAK